MKKNALSLLSEVVNFWIDMHKISGTDSYTPDDEEIERMEKYFIGLAKKDIKAKKREIEIIVLGGNVVDIKGLPKGWIYKVTDNDL